MNAPANRREIRGKVRVLVDAIAELLGADDLVESLSELDVEDMLALTHGSNALCKVLVSAQRKCRERRCNG